MKNEERERFRDRMRQKNEQMEMQEFTFKPQLVSRELSGSRIGNQSKAQKFKKLVIQNGAPTHIE